MKYLLFLGLCLSTVMYCLGDVKSVFADNETHEKEAKLRRFVELGDVVNVELMIADGADVNFKYEDGSTLLELAVRMNNEKVVSILINAGAKVDVRNADGLTLLHLATQNGNAKIIAALVEAGADLMEDGTDSKAEKEFYWRPFEPADFNYVDANGSTMLHNAAKNGQLEVTEVLINSGAEVNIKDNNGLTAFCIAKTHGYTQIEDLLAANGASTDCNDTQSIETN